MGRVLNIETAARFGTTAGPYARFLMTTQSAEELLLIKLPLEAQKPPSDVVVLMRSVTPTHGGEISLVMCDEDGARLVQNLVGHTEMPAYFSSRKLGNLGQFLSLHAEQVESLVLVGAAHHGNLTLARAVHIMASQDLSATEALAAAIDVDHAVVRMHKANAARLNHILAAA